ncbi:3-isopropylmalate dehydratase [Bartonella sp. DGB2]|uniref:LeuD/DmdB family oxidoreductase small subunit n=1 Tax=Bartonella sp. DGB2 TaxID=3388426 RepID=UPI00398FD2DA
MSSISGSIYILGDNIDTDQILSGEYLKVNPSTPEGYAQLASLAMCGLPEGSLPFIDEKAGRAKYPIIIAGKNFGCGSSREHAVRALGAAGVKAVVAQSYARIFFRNCVATGELLPISCDTHLNRELETGDQVIIHLDRQRIESNQKIFPLAPVGELAAIINAGGLFQYARKYKKI